MVRFMIAVVLLIAADGMAAEKTRVQLDWVPEPEFGGIYQAQLDGTFSRRGLDVEITPGGAGAPTWQLVADGKTPFAVASADEVMIARQQKADVVAIFATFQTNPQGIMVHRSRHVDSLAALFKSSGALAVEPGLPYLAWLKSIYFPSPIRLVSYDGGIAEFLHNPTLAQQCFITSEPIAARRAGSDPAVFLIADAGYNPYASVIITRGTFAHDHPETVRAMVGSLRAGWSAYFADPKSADAAMGKLNPDMDAETFAAASAAEKPLIETADTVDHGIGWMDLKRWKTLGDQLLGLKVLEQTPEAKDCFVTEAR